MEKKIEQKMLQIQSQKYELILIGSGKTSLEEYEGGKKVNDERKHSDIF